MLKNLKNKNMSNLINHAERELKLAGIREKDADYGGALYNAVMELVKVFSKQHSGASAERTLQLFNKVASYKNLMPLTGEDNEWNNISNKCGKLLQSNRKPDVFKKDDKAYYLDAIIWRTQTGSSWSGTAKKENGKKYQADNI